jgi:RNA polymerase sigma factor (sigma-70 family)
MSSHWQTNTQRKAASAQPSARPAPPYLSIVPEASRAPPAMSADQWTQHLIAVGRDQDRRAFAALFRHFAPRLKTWLIRTGSDERLAEDLMQDTWINVWRRAAQFDPQRAGVATWIFTIARNLRVDHHRRHSQATTVDLDDADEPADDSPDLETTMLGQEREARVRAALAQLPEAQRNVLQLSFFEEQPHARICAELGIPLGTVKSRVRLAVAHLRRLLDDLES